MKRKGKQNLSRYWFTAYYLQEPRTQQRSRPKKRLLAVAGTPDKILKLKTDDIERLIYPVGLYRTKARLLKRACRFLIINFNSRVPKDKKELMKIPGMGAKVASLVLEWGFNLPYIAVDTHVNRISQRLGAVPFNTKPEQAEKILEEMHYGCKVFFIHKLS